jgi:hypothetical protein
MLHDLDAHIAKISGQADYMKHLEVITGNVMQINMDRYQVKIQDVTKCDGNIRILFHRLCEKFPAETLKNMKETYTRTSEAVSVKKTFITKHKKGKQPHLIIADNHKPTDFVQTEWFNLVKKIESEINKFKSDVLGNITASTFEEYNAIAFDTLLKQQQADPLVLTLKTIFDVQIEAKETLDNFILMHRCASRIIDIFMHPMYDVGKTIESNWGKLEKVFKSGAFDGNPAIGKAEIILMLEQFIIANYRATITNNKKHYAQLFFKLVGNENIGALDGPRFLEIMDNINLEQLDKNDKIRSFATTARATLQKLINHETMSAEELIAQFNTIFNPPEKSAEDIEKETNTENMID